MAIFKPKQMTVKEIAGQVKGLSDEDFNALLGLFKDEVEDEPAPNDENKTEETEAEAVEPVAEETPQEEQAEETEEKTETSEEENGETPPETTEEAEEQRDAQDTIDALTARLEAQDEVIANLTERIDNIVAQLDDKPFGTQGKAKAQADDTTNDDAIMRSYNRNYRK